MAHWNGGDDGRRQRLGRGREPIVPSVGDVLDQFAELVAVRVADILAKEGAGREATGPTSDSPLLDVAAAAKYTGLAKSTLYSLSSSGRIPKVKLGSRVLFRQRDLDEYIERHLEDEERAIELAARLR